MIAESELIHKAFAKGLNAELPKSHKNVAKHVHDHANEIRSKVISDLNSLKEKGCRFGIDTDEYTTIGNKKFATINVYCTEYHVCLGLIRARGSTPATKYKELIEKRLQSFELDLNQIMDLNHKKFTLNQ